MNYEPYLGALRSTPSLAAELGAAAELTLVESRRALGMHGVRSATVKHPSGEWFVCRGPQDPECAQLLDVAVVLRAPRDIPCLAILEPPAAKARDLKMTEAFLRAYQGIVWRAFGVAFALGGPDRGFAFDDVAPTAAQRAEFGQLAGEIEAALREDAATASDGTRWMIPEDSREAEALVRFTMNRALRPKGYRRKVDGGACGKKYKGFWRGAEADGVWTKEKAEVRYLALESKFTEDVDAPLCQVVDHLAHLLSQGGCGGVLCVRVHRKGHDPKERMAGMKQLEEAMLVSYVDVVLG